ncbi:MAG: sigma factor [Maritimibacter sp.]
MREKKIALEAYLVASARLGDTRALNRLVALHGPRLLTHAARLLGERDAAHDVVQEACLSALGTAHRVAPCRPRDQAATKVAAAR